MMTEHWTDRLSEYLDGELEPAERSACEAHVADCGECAAVLAELEAVVTRASSLPDLPPSRDLWPAIENRLPRRSGRTAGADVIPIRRRRLSVTVPQLVAAAVALVLLSAGSVWVLLPTPQPAPLAVQATGPGPVVLTSGYDGVIRDLQTEFERRRDDLDPETVQVVETNLAIIDVAIAEAEAALGHEPSSGFLQAYLASALRQKVDLLRRVATIDQAEI